MTLTFMGTKLVVVKGSPPASLACTAMYLPGASFGHVVLKANVVALQGAFPCRIAPLRVHVVVAVNQQVAGDPREHHGVGDDAAVGRADRHLDRALRRERDLGKTVPGDAASFVDVLPASCFVASVTLE